MAELYPLLDPYIKVLEEYLRLVCRLWLERVNEELEAFAEALDLWLNDLSRHARPDWRESFDQLLARQEAEGRIIKPESRQDLLDYLDGWAKTVDWEAVTEQAAPRVASPRETAPAPAQQAIVMPPAPRPMVAGDTRGLRGRRTSEDQAFFENKLERAKARVAQMRQLLDSLGTRLDGAKLNEPVQVQQEVDAIEELIWLYNDDLESAQGAWLRLNLSHYDLEKLLTLETPAHLRLPAFLDREQRQRQHFQGQEISRRLSGRNQTADRVVKGMEIAEWVGWGAGMGAGACVLYSAARIGGKWVVVKTIAVAGAAMAAEQGVEAGLEAAGASEEVIRGTRLAAAVVAFIILRRRIAASRAKAKTPAQAEKPRKPTVADGKLEAHTQPEAPPKVPPRKEARRSPKGPKRSPSPATSQGTKTGPRPGSVTGNPENQCWTQEFPLNVASAG